MSSDLKDKAVKGVAWSLVERFGIQLMNFIIGIILARLLLPEDYGQLGMILIFYFVAEAFIQGGLGEAYVQKKEVSDTDANTVFFSNLGISALTYLLLWFAAPAISRFYDQPILTDLTRALSVVLIINAFNIIQQAQIKRALNFKRKTRITLIAALASGIIAVAAAYKGYGVWSLIIQRLTNSFILTAGLWITSHWKPRFSFSRQSFSDMFSFGAWILAASVIRSIFDNIYKVVIGKLFPVAELGYYTKAKTFQQIGSQQLTQSVSSVSMPVFSRMQDNKPRLRNAMATFSRHTAVFIMPIMVLVIVLAKPFVIILLTDKWAPMIPYLQLLCIVGFLYPMHAVNIQVLLAQGKSNLNFNLGMIKNVLRIINIAVMYRWGITWIIIGEAVLSVISLSINTYYTKRLIGYGLMQQLKDLKYILMISILSGILTYLIFFSVENLWIFFLGGAFCFGLLTITLHYILNRKYVNEIMDLVKNLTHGNSKTGNNKND